MPKSRNQKLKLWYLYKILDENTDENNPMTMAQIISALKKYDISAERKSIYSDIELLTYAGVDIIAEKRDKFVYYIGSRNFQLAELKLLVDCVQSSKFITAKKSAELISKLEKLTDRHNAAKLQRQVYITDRVKSANEKILYNVDFLHSAVNSGNKICFRYYQFITANEEKLKNNGEFYEVSPYGLVYSEDNYYLLAHYPKYEGITHFRVDKMTDISVLEAKSDCIEGVCDGKLDLAEYTKKMFGMFRGETHTVQLLCDEDILNVVTDKFGKNVFLRKESEGSYIVSVKADISPTFFGWLFTLGKKIKVLSPDAVVEEYKNYLKDIYKLY